MEENEKLKTKENFKSTKFSIENILQKDTKKLITNEETDEIIKFDEPSKPTIINYDEFFRRSSPHCKCGKLDLECNETKADVLRYEEKPHVNKMCTQNKFYKHNDTFENGYFHEEGCYVPEYKKSVTEDYFDTMLPERNHSLYCNCHICLVFSSLHKKGTSQRCCFENLYSSREFPHDLFRAAEQNIQNNNRNIQVRFSNHQSNELEKAFEMQKYISNDQRKQIASDIHLSERQVKTWFQNRRAKWRRIKLESKPPSLSSDKSLPCFPVIQDKLSGNN